MKKLDNFANSLQVLKRANFAAADLEETLKNKLREAEEDWADPVSSL